MYTFVTPLRRLLLALVILNSRSFIAVSCTVAALLLSSAATAQQRYSLEDIGSLGGRFTVGTGINETGQVVGWSRDANASYIVYHPFLYSSGIMQDIGTLGGVYSYGYAINASGSITGTSEIQPGGTGHAFLYSNGVMQDIGSLGGVGGSVGYGINNAGQITGMLNTNAGPQRAFLYTNGVMQDIGTLPGGDNGYSYGMAINASGQIVGQSSTQTSSHAFLYSNGTMHDLGALSGDNSSAYDINSSGVVVGTSAIDFTGNYHAFVFENGIMRDLGTLGGATSAAYGINDSGQIVGETAMTANQTYAHHAFLYENGSLHDLNEMIDPTSPYALYVTLHRATAINDSGWIVASGIDSRFDEMRTYLLRPSPVPLPGAVWLLVSGLALLHGFRSRIGK